MTLRTTELHEEIRCSMIEHGVDPFERRFRDDLDTMTLDATLNTPDLTKQVKGSVSFKYWRNFSSNLKYLESKSAKYKVQDVSTKDDQKCHKKRTKMTKPAKTQDIRQPSAQISYKFAPAGQTRTLFDSHIIGPINPVRSILRDTHISQPGGHSPDRSSPVGNTRCHVKTPVVLCPGDIGSAVAGGAMSQAPARGGHTPCITQCASMASSQQLDVERKTIPGGSFSASSRFDPPAPPVGTWSKYCPDTCACP